MILVVSSEQGIGNRESKTMFLFKMYTLKFEFDRHLEHIVSYQGMHSGLPLFVAGEFGAFEIFMQNYCFAKTDFSYFSNWKTSK